MPERPKPHPSKDGMVRGVAFLALTASGGRGIDAIDREALFGMAIGILPGLTEEQFEHGLALARMAAPELLPLLREGVR
ncbi:hypothetical protein MKK63_20335 [Methylobacterium sp. J-088]|uniref:hypothetical protein n=1 Tax=unclassified Methylobacterium TaxID=2615210 RepID=UPI001FB99D2A|nr:MULTISPECIES: hypothetical protein [unclassified Methylobacterium]MCJ2065040.1 hypothetical protein [Methylobacterium sp. J-088]